MKKVLSVNNLKVYFNTYGGTVKAVDDVSFDLYEKEILAIVGESGCGKSVTNKAILGLLKSSSIKVSGNVEFEGRNILNLSEKEYSTIRGNKIGMIFQEPMSSFDPLYKIGYQMMEVAKQHLKLNKKESKARIIDILKKVGIPEAERRFDEYPHEMSGGMLQRMMIAMTLLTNPKILIADEPTTALDVTIQAQVLNLMKTIQKEFGISIIFITHDLGVVAELADRVHVMYAGKIVEKASVNNIYDNPKHPYTEGLMKSRILKHYKNHELPYIKGFVPKGNNMPKGCRFNPRCSKVTDKCKAENPELMEVEKNHTAACWLYGGNK